MELQEYFDFRGKQARILNIGCGRTKPIDHFGIDITAHDCVDLVADLNDGIPIPDNSFDVVIAVDFLEHTIPQKNIFIMEEIYRVLAPNGRAYCVVPSTDGNNMGAFQDPTHFSFWNERKFWYFLDGKYGKGFRELYDIKSYFKPVSLRTYFNEYNVTYVEAILEKE